MNPISKALDEVKFTIPKDILETVFIKKDSYWRASPPSVDAIITSTVIRPRVLVDCNLIGGSEALISLAGLNPEMTNQYTAVYHIPKERTQGRSIISALNVTFADPYVGNTSGMSTSACGASQLLSAGQGVLDAASSIPIVSTSNVQLIGENVVMIRGSQMLPTNVYLRCLIANDDNMNHLQIRAYKHFAHACVLAVKAYIYNNHIIIMDQAELAGGLALGKFKDIVEGYADAEELYQTNLREKLQKVLFMNDRETYQRHLKTMIGNFH